MTWQADHAAGQAGRRALLEALEKLQMADRLLERLLARQDSASLSVQKAGRVLGARRELRRAVALLRMRLN